MATSVVHAVERLLAKVLLPLCVVSGAVVLSGFFFPEFVGQAVTGATWLAVALVFFVSGLGYLAVLPYAADSPESAGEPVLLGIRRTRPVDVVRELFTEQDSVVLAVPVAVFATFFLVQTLFPSTTAEAVDTASETVLLEAGPMFLAVVFLAVCYCLFLLLGPWGDIVLGDEDAEPSYTYPT